MNDVFNTMKWASETNASGYRFKLDNVLDFRAAYLNISYRFGNTQDYYTKKKKIKQNTNETNDQQDNMVR